MRSHGQVFRRRLEKCDAEFRERVGTGGAKGTHRTARPLFLCSFIKLKERKFKGNRD